MSLLDDIRARVEANRELAQLCAPIALRVSNALDQSADDLEYLLEQLQIAGRRIRRLSSTHRRFEIDPEKFLAPEKGVVASGLEQPAGIRPAEETEYTVVEPSESISQLQRQLTKVVEEACTNLRRRLERERDEVER